MAKVIKPESLDQFIGAALRGALNEKGITQDEAAAAMSMSPSTFGRRIRGSASLFVSELLRMESVLKIDAVSVMNNAIRNYGGIDKLMSEVAGTKEATVTPIGGWSAQDFESYRGDQAAMQTDADAAEDEPSET